VGGRRRGRASIIEQVDYGTAELFADPDRPGGWTLALDGYPQSYVDLGDPGHLEFEYVRRLASIVDAAAPLGTPLTVLHLGGGGLTLPRYVAATRARSVQRVVERDAALIALVRRMLPLPRGADIRVRAEDARVAVEAFAPSRFDLIISDVYGGARVPGSLGSVEFAAEVARVLTPGGIYAANLADGAPLAYARAQAATIRARFGDVCLLAEPGVLRGRRYGNVVMVAAAAAGRLPTAELAAAAARDPFPARLMAGDDLDRFIAGARPTTDATAVDSPPPPESLFT
jgi:spermidine synthase